MRSAVPVLFLLFVTALVPVSVRAQTSVAGEWEVDLFVNEQLFSQHRWTLALEGGRVTGSGTSPTQTLTVTGLLDGDAITLRENWADQFFVDLEGTVSPDFLTMTGSFSDADETAGSWTARRPVPDDGGGDGGGGDGGDGEPPATDDDVLTPETVLTAPPDVSVQSNDVTLTARRFTRAELSRDTPPGGRRRRRLVIRYEFRIVRTGPVAEEVVLRRSTPVKVNASQDRIRLISRRNRVTARNLAPGSYASTYRVTAVRGERRVITTDPSPSATFGITPRGT